MSVTESGPRVLRTLSDTDTLCVNTIRTLAMDAVQKANSGHAGTPMEAATLAYALWTKFLRHDPKDPHWPGRDRFILSSGHASMLIYSLLHLTGYDLSLDDLKEFRQLGSKTPGHPERHPELGIETTTGPLGQGFANGVGMAMAQQYMSSKYARSGYEDLFAHNIWGICSDGDMQEGISHEAASIAGHLKLGSLGFIYLDNHITIDGTTELSMSEEVGTRFQAYGWHVQHIGGEDYTGICEALEAAKGQTDRPSIIIARTHIGIGSPNKQDTSAAHGAPLGVEEIKATKENLGWPADKDFYVPDDALARFRGAIDNGARMNKAWRDRWSLFEADYPEVAAEWTQISNRELPDGWDKDLPVYSPEDGAIASRKASEAAINAIAPNLPHLIGGSADLAASNNTTMKGETDYLPGSPGRNLHFGIREHGMASITNGIAFSTGLIPYCATFLIFSDYLRPTIRLASISKGHVIYVFTHDSVGVGEDGPTHQPVEQIASLRTIPGLTVIRPSDGNETNEAWKIAIKKQDGPVALILTRQGLPTIDRQTYPPASMLERGAYVLGDPAGDDEPEVIIIATGSEVGCSFDAWRTLNEEGIAARLVAMPSWELFAAQDADYIDAVIPPTINKRVAVEAGRSFGWERWVGNTGLILGIDRFGASGPGGKVLAEYGFTEENIVSEIKSYLDR